MYGVNIAKPDDAAAFRAVCRRLVEMRADPAEVAWSEGAEASLFADLDGDAAASLHVPRAAVDLVDLVVCHRGPERFALLHGLIDRIVAGERRLLDDPTDPLVARLRGMEKAIRRDVHKMTAFVRFHRIEDAGGERFVAWYEPDHRILRLAAPFFVNRFHGIDWSILTPDGSRHWRDHTLSEGPPSARPEAAGGDALHDWWRTYYASTFNPARVNPIAMRREMPKKRWHNLPETAAIPALLRAAKTRTDTMLDAPPTPPRRPRTPPPPITDPDDLRAAIRGCDRCGICPHATAPVPGVGPVGVALAIVGEQPGDVEDAAGLPFVGPAGGVLAAALADAGLKREDVFLTNAVKGFKFKLRGKRRLHRVPDPDEITACRPWLLRELALVRPKLVVTLGVTALRALTGYKHPLKAVRGQTLLGAHGGPVLATWHPAYVLRLGDPEARAGAETELRADIAAAARYV